MWRAERRRRSSPGSLCGGRYGHVSPTDVAGITAIDDVAMHAGGARAGLGAVVRIYQRAWNAHTFDFESDVGHSDRTRYAQQMQVSSTIRLLDGRWVFQHIHWGRGWF